MFFCRRLATRREDIFRYFVFSASSRLVVYLIEAGFHYDEFLCLFVCFFKKDVFRLVKSVGQDKYLQILPLRCPTVQSNNSMVT